MYKIKVILIKKEPHTILVSSPHMEGHFCTGSNHNTEPRKLAQAFLIMFATTETEIVSDDGMGTAFYFTMETPNELS